MTPGPSPWPRGPSAPERAVDIVVCVTLGTGVGGGIMIDGSLHGGAFGVAGELGHQTIVPDGPLCGCGNRGCVEALTRADVLASLAGKEYSRGGLRGSGRGEERSLAAIRQVAEYLGIGLANVVTLLGPDRIIIGGGIADAGELVLGADSAGGPSTGDLGADRADRRGGGQSWGRCGGTRGSPRRCPQTLTRSR